MAKPFTPDQFTKLDKEITALVRDVLMRQITAPDANARGIAAAMASSLISEAAQLMHLVDMPRRMMQTVIRLSVYMGELSALVMEEKITRDEATELIEGFTKYLHVELDAEFGPEER